MIITKELMTSEDYTQITDIWLESNIKTHNFISKNYWLNNVAYFKSAIRNVELLAYKEGNEILGFIGANDDYIEGLFVADKHRKKGIGRLLLDELKVKHEILKLFVYKKNQNALNFYLSREFEIFSEEIEEETGELNISMVWKKS
ncbi:hypothetical protein RD055328_02240 [Companilactobacillus sp. RD055328]|uniref:GNAT family N-acetyltransferase n=1 Tax=Companilactobacillus sp. RD055328 TaxID=2916634 RepID=UPI001FC8AD82|nr:GNAT family N-acetyltransferase [Companilactobacillus sp. RD055328]GKQ42301.1 hypothetical protein RD055328_02240 [Companilactobacillus sp. RD055328]